jgi:hypothetical protein
LLASAESMIQGRKHVRIFIIAGKNISYGINERWPIAAFKGKRKTRIVFLVAAVVTTFVNPCFDLIIFSKKFFQKKSSLRNTKDLAFRLERCYLIQALRRCGVAFLRHLSSKRKVSLSGAMQKCGTLKQPSKLERHIR